MLDDVEQLIAVLAPASGVERARAVVQEACTEAGAPFPPPKERMRAVTQRLAERSGAIGAAIRLALRRAATRKPDGPARPVDAERGEPAPPAPEPGLPEPGSRLVHLLAPALGESKARSAVAEVARRLGLTARRWSERDEVHVLDTLAAGTDYVATVARFAKAKTMLDSKG